MADKKIVAVIPALNEEETILKVIRGVKKYADEIVLVDDASLDKTVDIAKREGALVVSHDRTQGYDRSIDDGFVLAAKRGAGVIFTFDADGQHNYEDIPKIITPILNREADVVVGRRPYRARFTEHLFAFVSRIKAGIDDPLCGLKAYHIDVYKDVKYFDKIFSIGTQLMFNAKKRGYRILQRDINLNQRKDIPRFGKLVKANYKIFKAICKTLLWDLVGSEKRTV